MPERARKPNFPRWVEQERLGDMAWIAENLHVLFPAAQAAYAELGRGAITVDTTVHPPSQGHPFAYFTQEQLLDLGDADTLRMLAEYDPTWEMVATLLKTRERLSTYRIGVPSAKPPTEPTSS